MKRWLPLILAPIGGAIAFAIAYALASDDIHKAGDFHEGPQRFIGFVAAGGVGAGFFLGVLISRGRARERDGYTLVYRRIEPTATSYREVTTLTVADLVAALRTFGYEPRIDGCTDDGVRKGELDPSTALAGANVALTDRGVRGWLRLQLPVPQDGQPRALGLLEVWIDRGESAREFALFVMRALDGLVGGLSATPESSQLSDDPVSLLTAGLGDRPAHRRA